MHLMPLLLSLLVGLLLGLIALGIQRVHSPEGDGGLITLGVIATGWPRHSRICHLSAVGCQVIRIN
jgi:hypothetical protein